MLFEGLCEKIDVFFRKAKAYSTYNRFDNLGDLVRTSNQGKKLVEEEGKFYVVKGDKKEPAFIPQHYECDGCGIVKGSPGRRGFNDIGVLSGGEGYETYCTICDNIIDRHYTVRS